MAFSPLWTGGFDSIVQSGSETAGSVANKGYVGNGFDVFQNNTLSTEITGRKSISGSTRVLQLRFKLDSSGTFSGECCIAHGWSGSNFTSDLFELRLSRVNGTTFNMKITDVGGGHSAVGATNLTTGKWHKAIVVISDTGIKVFIEENTSVECQLTGLSLSGLNIGSVAIGKYFAQGFNGHMYFDGFVALPATTTQTTNTQKLNDTYNGFIQRYQAGEGPVIRPQGEGSGTTNGDDIVSEGNAYGMLFAVIENDQTVFNSIESFNQNHLERKNNPALTTALSLMAWHYDNENNIVLDWNYASDADCDRLLALLMADSLWGSGGSINYKSKATSIIADMKAYMFNSYGGKQYQCGDITGLGVSPFEQNVSYFSPVMARRIYQFNGDPFWLQVIEGYYDVYQQTTQNSGALQTTAGLFPNWNFFKTDTGLVAVDTLGGRDNKYDFNAFRATARMYWDYLFYKEARAKTQLTGNIYTFLKNYYNSNSQTLATQYNHDGSLNGGAYEKSCFYGVNMFPFILAGDPIGTTIYNNKVMGSYKQDSTGSYFADTPGTSTPTYFNTAWALFAGLIQEGIFKNTGTIATYPKVTGLMIEFDDLSSETQKS